VGKRCQGQKDHLIRTTPGSYAHTQHSSEWGGECQVGVRTAGFRRPKTSVRLHQRINSSDKCLHPAGKRLLIQFPNVEIQKQIGLQISLVFADYSKLYFFYRKSLSQLTELRPSSSIRSSMQNWQNGAFYSFLGRGRARARMAETVWVHEHIQTCYLFQSTRFVMLSNNRRISKSLKLSISVFTF